MTETPIVKKPKTRSDWGRTRNGVRQYLRTGIWHYNKRVGRQFITGSSESTSKTIAQTKLAQKIGQVRKQPGASPLAKTDRQTVGDLIAIFKHRLAGSGLDPKTQIKKQCVLASVISSWAATPEFKELGLADLNAVFPKKVGLDVLICWRNHFLKSEAEGGAGYSPDYFNQARTILNELFEIAVEYSQILLNPVPRLKWAKVPKQELILPTAEEFERIVAAVDQGFTNRNTSHCKDLILGLSFTGLRIEEAQLLRTRHVDLAGWKLELPATIVKGKRRGRSVPILPEAQPLFKRLYENAGPNGEIFRVKECEKTLKSACKKAGWNHPLTHHKLRHYFATRCLENTKDVKVVADWLGHVDGGKLCLTTYAHVCRQFANDAARQIRFNKPTPSNGTEANATQKRIESLRAELAELEARAA